jgi:amidase
MVALRLLCRLSAIAPLVAYVAGQYSLPHSSLPLLLNATTEELAAGLQSKSFRSVDLVQVNFTQWRVKIACLLLQAYIERIQEVNSILNVVTEINPDALKIARQLDKERARGKLRG